MSVVTNGSGNATFNVGYPNKPGNWVTAAATYAAGNTSEFSLARQKL